MTRLFETGPDRDIAQALYDQYRMNDAMLMYYCGIPFPDELDDDTYWEKLEQLKWIREKESKMQAGKPPQPGGRPGMRRF